MKIPSGDTAHTSMMRRHVSCSVPLHKAQWCKGGPVGSYECQYQALPQDHCFRVEVANIKTSKK